MNGPTLSIVIPAFNEERRILATLEKIDAFLQAQSFTWEVLVVDDCSRDNTVSVVTQFIAARPHYRLLRNERNIGKGGSVKRGMLEVSGQYRLFSDADLSTPIEEATRFLQLMEGSPLPNPSPPDGERGQGEGGQGYDVIIGSRRVKGAHVALRQPVFREAAGRIFSVLVRLLTLRGFIDTQCGFKMFTMPVAEQIFKRQTINRFGFDVEILFIANRLGYKIIEAPVTWFDSPFTRVRLLRDSTRMFLDLLAIRLNSWRGRYR